MATQKGWVVSASFSRERLSFSRVLSAEDGNRDVTANSTQIVVTLQSESARVIETQHGSDGQPRHRAVWPHLPRHVMTLPRGPYAASSLSRWLMTVVTPSPRMVTP